MVECQLPKLKVAGSNPVSRSIKPLDYNRAALSFYAYIPLVKATDHMGFKRRDLNDIEPRSHMTRTVYGVGISISA